MFLYIAECFWALRLAYEQATPIALTRVKIEKPVCIEVIKASGASKTEALPINRLRIKEMDDIAVSIPRVRIVAERLAATP